MISSLLWQSFNGIIWKKMMLYAMSNLYIADVGVQRLNDDTRPNCDTQISTPNSDINVILENLTQI